VVQQRPAPLIAIVDDDASVRTSTDRLIRSFGYRTQTFASGAELLDSDTIERAACLLLDVRMPGMSGLDVQRTLVDRGARIPIVFISAHASDADEQHARGAGAVEFLRKPVSDAALRGCIENVIREGHGGS